MRRIIFVWFILVGLMMIGVTAAAPIENLTVSDYGSNFITWEWDFNETTTASIYIDGVKKLNETSLNYFTLSDLNPCESHTITLVNATNASDIYATNTAQTFYPFSVFSILFIFLMVFLTLMLFMRDEAMITLFGTIAFVLGLFAYRMSYPYHYTLLSYGCLGVAVFSVIWVLLAVISLMVRTSSWDRI